ncbi:cobalamin biosynthesis protein [Roseomonas marmotae]|nr:cobalamin biosynthesis protein [Roseomonas marmotae]
MAAGLGCRAGAEAEDILALLAEAVRGLPALTHLAAPEFRRDVPGLRRAAERLGLPLLFLPRAALEQMQPLCPTRSEAALRATGLASVAEACALAAAGPGATLVRPRIAGAGVTCAVAAGSGA